MGECVGIAQPLRVADGRPSCSESISPGGRMWRSAPRRDPVGDVHRRPLRPARTGAQSGNSKSGVRENELHEVPVRWLVRLVKE